MYIGAIKYFNKIIGYIGKETITLISSKGNHSTYPYLQANVWEGSPEQVIYRVYGEDEHGDWGYEIDMNPKTGEGFFSHL